MRVRIEEIRRPFEKRVKAAYPAASTPTIGEFNRLNVRSLTILTMAYNDKKRLQQLC